MASTCASTELDGGVAAANDSVTKPAVSLVGDVGVNQPHRGGNGPFEAQAAQERWGGTKGSLGCQKAAHLELRIEASPELANELEDDPFVEDE